MSEIQEMNLESESLVEDRLAKLREMMPEVFTEGGIDFDKLRLELGDEVDEGQERYAFTWPGKADAIRQSQTPSTATLRPCVEKSRGRDGEDGSFDTDNIYIEGDNLEVLKLLQRGYHGKVKMIYIDPPYNTGKDFVYHDSFGDTIENYKAQAKLTGQSNADTSGRYHSVWCSMMYPRLRLARELLAEDGVLAISIGTQEIDNLIRLCNDIFQGSQVMPVTVQTSGGKPNGCFNVTNEYVVFVASKKFEPIASEEDKKSYASPYHGMNLATFNQVQRPNQVYPIFVNDKGVIVGAGHTLQEMMNHREYTGNVEDYVYDFGLAPEGTSAVWPITSKNEQCVWRLIPSRLMDDWQKGYIKVVPQSDKSPNKWGVQYLSGGIIEKVESGELESRRLTENPDIPTLEILNYMTEASTIPTLWTDKSFYTSRGSDQIKELFNGVKPFDYPKPVDLISNILKRVVSPGEMVIDFFSGAATTAHALMSLNANDDGGRSYILVQLPELCDEKKAAYKEGYRTLCEVGEERIRRAGDKIKAEIEGANKQPKLGEEPKKLPDIGFRVFTLDESGIEKPEPGKLMLDVVKPDRTDEDIVFEMMLKWGLELTLPVEKEEVAGYPVYTVAYGELICCLASGLTMEALEAIADMEPRRVLMRDSILTDTLKLNAVQAFKRVEERTGREVELRTV